jgi:hypothetical protein
MFVWWTACRPDGTGRDRPQPPSPLETADTGPTACATSSTGATGDTAAPIEPVDVCGHAVAGSRPVAGRRLAGVVDASDPWWEASGVLMNGALGWNGAAGDFDGDGVMDLAVDHILPDYGVSIFLGPLVPGTWNEPDAVSFAIVASPRTADFRFGFTDVDLDGTTELLFHSISGVDISWRSVTSPLARQASSRPLPFIRRRRGWTAPPGWAATCRD